MTERPPQEQARPSVEMVLERGKIREFARATRSSNSAYLDDPQPVMPVTFLRTSAFWRGAGGGGAGRGGGGRAAAAAAAAGASATPGPGASATPGAGAGAAGGTAGQRPAGRRGGGGTALHGGEEYIFHGPPPRAGTKLTVTSHVIDRYEKEGKRGGTMTFTITASEYRDEDGNLRVEGRSTMISTSRPTTQKEG